MKRIILKSASMIAEKIHKESERTNLIDRSELSRIGRATRSKPPTRAVVSHVSRIAVHTENGASTATAAPPTAGKRRASEATPLAIAAEAAIGSAMAVAGRPTATAGLGMAAARACNGVERHLLGLATCELEFEAPVARRRSDMTSVHRLRRSRPSRSETSKLRRDRKQRVDDELRAKQYGANKFTQTYKNTCEARDAMKGDGCC